MKIFLTNDRERIGWRGQWVPWSLMLACCLAAGSVAVCFAATGCRSADSEPYLAARPVVVSGEPKLTPGIDGSRVSQVAYQHPVVADPGIAIALPPRVDQFDSLPRMSMSLDTAVQLALNNSVVIGDLGGRVLTMPDSVSTTMDPGLVATDPRMGIDAALSAFDTQIESGVVYNGGGNIVNSAFSSGQFGVFAQPETLAKLGVGRVLAGGTKVSLGGVAGYDEELAGGPFAAFGGDIRHPLMRGGGREFNEIAGPGGRPGLYAGTLIASAKHHQSQLVLEQAVRDLIRDVASTYWELHYAYLDVATKQTAVQNAKETWERVRQRVDAAAAPGDYEALAYQQLCVAQAALVSAIGGTQYSGAGAYPTELRLRTLLNLPTADGQLIFPDATPLTTEIIFDWQETLQLARVNRVELRRQQDVIRQKELEITAARNLQLAQVDLLGAYRKLGDDPDTESPLFGQALDGWQVGVEVRRSVSNRLENAAVRNARIRHSREIAIMHSQQQSIDAELQRAVTQLDRSWSVMQALAAAESAARTRLDAQTKRYQAGDDQIEDVLDAQTKLTLAATNFQRAIVDYNLAFIGLHHARGTLMQTVGVGLVSSTADEVRFAQTTSSVFAR